MTTDHSTQNKPPKRRKWLRRLLLFLLAIPLFMVLLWTGMQTPWGKDRLTDLLARATAHTGSYHTKIEGLRGMLPFSVIADRFTLSDEHGTWLEAQHTDISLNPWALVSGIIEVKRFRMEHLSISRLPKPTKDHSKKKELDDEGKSPLSLPHFMVHEIGINRISLNRAVAGIPRTYTLQSNIEALGPRIKTRLSLKDLESEKDILRIKGTYDTHSGKIASKLTYQEGTGGLVSALANLKDARGIRLDLQADGLLPELSGRLRVETGGYGQVDVNYQLIMSEILSIALQGRIEPEKGMLPPRVEGALGGPGVDVNGRATMSLEKRLHIEQFDARTPSTAISLSGTVDWMKEIMDVHVDADSLNIKPFIQGAEITYKDLGRVQLTAEGPFHQPDISIRAFIGALQTQQGEFKQVSINAKGRPLRDFTGLEGAEASVLAQELSIPEVPRLRGPLRVNLAAKSPDFIAWEIDKLHLTLKDTDVRIVDGRINPLDGHFNATIETQLDRLRPFMPAAIRDMDAKLKTHIRATGNYHTMRIHTHLNAVLSEITGSPPAVTKAIGPELTLDAQAGLMDGTLHIQDARVAGRDGSLIVKGYINTGTGGFDAQYQLDMNALKTLTGITGQPLAGTVKSRGNITGTMTDFNADIGLDSNDLHINGLITRDLHARITVRGLPQNPSGNLTFEGTVLEQSATLRTNFHWSGETLSLSSARANLPGVDLNADLDINTSDGRVNGTARGNIESFEFVRAVSGLDLLGMGSFHLKAHADRDHAGATLDARFTDLKYGAYGISELTLKTRINDLNKLHVGVEIAAKDMAIEAGRFDTLTIEAKGNPKNASIDLNTRGSAFRTGVDDATGAPIVLSTRLHIKYEDMWRFRLDHLKTTYKDLNVSLSTPATITMHNNRFVLDHLTLDAATGRLQATGEINPEKIDFSARIDDIPLALLEPFIDRDLSGTVTINLNVSGPLADPEIQVKAHVRDYRIPGAENLEPVFLEAKMDAERRQKHFLVDAAILGLGESPFTATANIPAHVSLAPPGFHLDETADLMAELKGHIDLTLLNSFRGMDDQKVRGLMDVNLGVTGSIQKWALKGGVTLSQGRYENVGMGLILDDIEMRMRAEDRSLRVEAFSARDGAKGSVSIEGGISISPPFPMDARLSFNQAVLVRKEILTSTTSGKLDLRGNKDVLNLSGEITLDRTELTIPRRLPPDVVEIPVEEINLPKGMAATTSQESGEALKFLLMNLTLKIPARFFVRGHGLDAEFKGQINIKGPAHRPVVRGTLSVVRGTYQFLARTFHITEGQIAFDGSTPPAPFLNVTAEVKAGTIDAQVRITGPTNGFTLSLTSQPPLPQDEIMANILFGQSAAKLNPFQAYQLASALAQLSGHDMPDVMGKTRRVLGLDRLTISGGNNGSDDENDDGPSVEVGKYVSEKVYVGIEQDITDAKQDVKVEVDITPNFSVESKAGTKSGAGLGFSWKYDY